MQVKNISNKELNIAGNRIPKDEEFNVNDCLEIRLLIKEKKLKKI